MPPSGSFSQNEYLFFFGAVARAFRADKDELLCFRNGTVNVPAFFSVNKKCISGLIPTESEAVKAVRCSFKRKALLAFTLQILAAAVPVYSV